MLGAAALITSPFVFVPRTASLWCGHPDITRILPPPCKGLFPSRRALGWHVGTPKKTSPWLKITDRSRLTFPRTYPYPGGRESPPFGELMSQEERVLRKGPSVNQLQLPLCRGFCFFNSVAIAARQLQQKGKLSKILIVDWVSPLCPPACPCSSPGRPQELWFGARPESSETSSFRDQLPERGWEPPGMSGWGSRSRSWGWGNQALEQGRDLVAFSSVRLSGRPQG